MDPADCFQLRSAWGNYEFAAGKVSGFVVEFHLRSIGRFCSISSNFSLEVSGGFVAVMVYKYSSMYTFERA